jgi:hypothetical protein
LMSCLVQAGQYIVCLGGTSKSHEVAQVVDDGSEASASSGVPISETTAPRGTILSAGGLYLRLLK